MWKMKSDIEEFNPQTIGIVRGEKLTYPDGVEYHPIINYYLLPQDLGLFGELVQVVDVQKVINEMEEWNEIL